MSKWTSYLFDKIELGLYDFIYPGKILLNEARIEASYKTLTPDSPDLGMIQEVQGERLCQVRFKRGETCFTAVHENRVVSYIWGSRSKVGVDEISMAVQTASNEMYLYDAFTLEPWRGKNLYPAVLRRALEFGREQGLARSTIFVEARNTPSIRGVKKGGFTQFQTLFLKTILGFGKSKLLPPLEGHASVKFVPHIHQI